MTDHIDYRLAKSKIPDIPGQFMLDGQVSRATGRSVKKQDWSMPVRTMHQRYENGSYIGYVYDDDGSPVPKDEWPKR